MSLIGNIQQFTDYWKNLYPDIFGDLTDQEIVDEVRTNYPDLEIPEWEEVLATAEDSPNVVGGSVVQDPSMLPTTEHTPQNTSLSDTDIDPLSIAQWFSQASFIPESARQEGLLGISPEYFQEMYNNSIPGLAYKSWHGENKYTIEDYDANYLLQAGQYFLGMLNPMDVAIMAATGGIGKAAQLTTRTSLFGGTKYIEKGILSGLVSKYPTMGTFGRTIADQTVAWGVGGASFSAAHALMNDVAEQRTMDASGEIGQVNIHKAMKVASDEFLHSLPMFAAIGGVTSGLMGATYGWASVAMKQGSMAQKMTKAITHPSMRYGSEVFSFTQIPLMMSDDPNAPKMGDKEWWDLLGQNAFMVGGFKLIGKMTGGHKKDIDAFTFLKTHMENKGLIDKNIRKSTQSAVENLDPKSVPMEFRESIRDLIVKEGNLNKSIKQGGNDLEFIRDITSKLDNPSYLEKAKTKGSKERKEVAEYMDKVAEYSKGTIGVIDEVLKDGEQGIATSFKNYHGREGNKTELKRWGTTLTSWKNDLVKSHDWLNTYQSGGWTLPDANGTRGGKIDPPEKVIPDYGVRTNIEGFSRIEAVEGSSVKRKWDYQMVEDVAKKYNLSYDPQK